MRYMQVNSVYKQSVPELCPTSLHLAVWAKMLKLNVFCLYFCYLETSMNFCLVKMFSGMCMVVWMDVWRLAMWFMIITLGIAGTLTCFVLLIDFKPLLSFITIQLTCRNIPRTFFTLMLGSESSGGICYICVLYNVCSSCIACLKIKMVCPHEKIWLKSVISFSFKRKSNYSGARVLMFYCNGWVLAHKNFAPLPAQIPACRCPLPCEGGGVLSNNSTPTVSLKTCRVRGEVLFLTR